MIEKKTDAPKILLQNDPENAEVCHLNGMFCLQSGKLAEARQWFSRAIDLIPDIASYHCSLGHALYLDGYPEKAIPCYEQALALEPFLLEALSNRGMALLDIGRSSDALSQLLQVVEHYPAFPEAYVSLVQALIQLGHYQEALPFSQHILKLRPNDAEAYFSLAYLFQQLGEAALPHSIERNRHFEEAVQWYRAGLMHQANHPDAYYNLGNIYLQQDCFEEAETCYRQVLTWAPDYAKAYCNLGMIYKRRLKLSKAVNQFQKAIQLQPDFRDAHLNLATTLLLIEDFEHGWTEYEWRPAKTEFTRHLQKPEWDGRAFPNQRLLVRSEQGFGDTFQFVRYLPMVKALGGTVILECMPEMQSLLSACAGVDEIVHYHSPLYQGEFDLHVPLLSLPKHFNTNESNIPRIIPYIFPVHSLIIDWQERLKADSRFKIGFVWAGNPQNYEGANRSAPVAFFKDLISRHKTLSFYSLQKGLLLEEHYPSNTCDLSGSLDNFSETAAVIANLDLVISVDTSVAHLTGAMGKPIWLLLPYLPDWRWMLNRMESPWYPTMRLFRQQTFGCWEHVFEEISVSLADFTREI